jgi:hypothetical protein
MAQAAKGFDMNIEEFGLYLHVDDLYSNLVHLTS